MEKKYNVIVAVTFSFVLKTCLHDSNRVLSKNQQIFVHLALCITKKLKNGRKRTHTYNKTVTNSQTFVSLFYTRIFPFALAIYTNIIRTTYLLIKKILRWKFYKINNALIVNFRRKRNNITVCFSRFFFRKISFSYLLVTYFVAINCKRKMNSKAVFIDILHMLEKLKNAEG
jgi:hypothetical protein